MDTLADAAVVITAGGNGIGRSIALAMAEAGADVVVSDISISAAANVRDEILALRRRAIAVPADVAKLSDVQELADASYSAFGRVDVLCNNAGVAVRPMRPVWEFAYEDLQWMINVNLWGVLNGVHVFLPRMRAQPGRKHIVNTCSMAALTPVLGNAIYGLTKSAIDGYSDVIREELRLESIGVTTLYPGLVSTDAPENTRKLRTAEQQKADASVKSIDDYMREKGNARASDANRGGYSVIGAGQTLRAIPPAWVGQAVVDAVQSNRPYCMTHPPPIDAIVRKTEAWLDAYVPVPGTEHFFDPQ
jgi:NADP-dependent 3-hydroxy acid dehydrogenase YdfG